MRKHRSVPGQVPDRRSLGAGLQLGRGGPTKSDPSGSRLEQSVEPGGFGEVIVPGRLQEMRHAVAIDTPYQRRDFRHGPRRCGLRRRLDHQRRGDARHHRRGLDIRDLRSLFAAIIPAVAVAAGRYGCLPSPPFCRHKKISDSLASDHRAGGACGDHDALRSGRDQGGNRLTHKGSNLGPLPCEGNALPCLAFGSSEKS